LWSNLLGNSGQKIALGQLKEVERLSHFGCFLAYLTLTNRVSCGQVHEGAQVGISPAAKPRSMWTSESLRESVSISRNPQPVDALSSLQTAEITPQKLPLGSGITEAACKIVFTQRFKRSGMSWTIQGGQTILDLRVIKLSRVWEEVHQKYLASKSMPVIQFGVLKAAQRGRQAA
jgi:hypothetical protein